MVVKAETLLEMEEFKGMDADTLSMKLDAAENLIRSYTNNNFQNRIMRIEAASVGGELTGSCPYFEAGDTLQITRSGVNDGLYVVEGITGASIRLKGSHRLYDCPSNMVTKVVYPADIQKGVIDMMVWEKNNRQKVGVKSETLSRHEVTYFDQDSGNQVMGYPVSLLGFLKPYIKPRF